jgi:hypothetical protein
MMASNFCGECGAQGPFEDPGYCDNCLTHDRVKPRVDALHEYAVTLLRRADRAAVTRRLNIERDQAAAALAAARERGPGLEAERAAAVTAEREAADTARTAVQQHRRRQDQVRRAVRDGITGDPLEEAQWKAEQAGRNAAGATDDHELAVAALRAADAALEAWQAGDQAAEDNAVKAAKAAENPPKVVPVSLDTTLAANPLTVLKYAAAAQQDGDPLPMGGIMAHAEILATATGQKDAWTRDARAAAQAAAEETMRKEPVVVPNSDGSMSVHPPRAIRAGRR